MAQFMGPGAVSVLVLVWWVFFSRARLSEKLIGAIGLLLIAVATTMLEDKTVQGMGTMISAVPWGATAFALGAICFRSLSPARLVRGSAGGFDWVWILDPGSYGFDPWRFQNGSSLAVAANTGGSFFGNAETRTSGQGAGKRAEFRLRSQTRSGPEFRGPQPRWSHAGCIN